MMKGVYVRHRLHLFRLYFSKSEVYWNNGHITFRQCCLCGHANSSFNNKFIQPINFPIHTRHRKTADKKQTQQPTPDGQYFTPTTTRNFFITILQEVNSRILTISKALVSQIMESSSLKMAKDLRMELMVFGFNRPKIIRL